MSLSLPRSKRCRSVEARARRFLATRDSAYLATANAAGQPYVQHRGRPKGFIRVLDERTLGFANFVGNRQYITTGNLAENDRTFLFLMDYAERHRAKIWGRARVVENDPDLLARLMPKGYDARPQQAILFTIDAWDVNCPSTFRKSSMPPMSPSPLKNWSVASTSSNQRTRACASCSPEPRMRIREKNYRNESRYPRDAEGAMKRLRHSDPSAEAKRVLILGGGFGGIYAALRLEKLLAHHAELEVTLVTRENYFLFTPMLPEVAAGELELSTIINPLRRLLRRVKSFVGMIEAIDLRARRVTVSHAFDSHTHELPYDRLILALGAGTNFFNLPGVEGCCLTIKTLGDAVAIRNQLISHLEEANSECAAGERQPLLTFIVAGGGFAGVETLGGINDFVREAIRFYPNLCPDYLRFILVTPDEVILPELNRKLGIYAQRKIALRGVEIVTGAKVEAFRDGVVELTNGERIPANTLIWTAGTAPNPLIAALPLPKRNGRIAVNDYLGVDGWPGVWAVGDCALVANPRAGGFYPPTAQHALREGRAVARNVAATLYGGRKRPFRYSTVGQLAAIGRHMGVANILGVNFSGFFAWWLWRTIYLSKLPRMEKKIRVALDWTLDLCFPKDFACVTTPARGRARSTSALRARGEAAAQGGSSSENRRARLERSHERL